MQERAKRHAWSVLLYLQQPPAGFCSWFLFRSSVSGMKLEKQQKKRKQKQRVGEVGEWSRVAGREGAREERGRRVAVECVVFLSEVKFRYCVCRPSRSSAERDK